MMAYEYGATLAINYLVESVGKYWITYTKIKEENGRRVKNMHLVTTESPREQEIRISSLESCDGIEVDGSGKLLEEVDVRELLNPLFAKIKNLEEDIKLLQENNK